VSAPHGRCGSSSLRADRSDGRGPLRVADGRAGAAGREAARSATATDPHCARPSSCRRAR
jgi:hypothetical protein